MMITVLVAAAGALGALARYLLDTMITLRVRSFPAGTMIINLSGSLLLGLITGLAVGVLPAGLQTALGAGFLGGYTTFSTACVQTVRLLQGRRWVAALISGAGTMVLATAAASVGLLLGRGL